MIIFYMKKMPFACSKKLEKFLIEYNDDDDDD